MLTGAFENPAKGGPQGNFLIGSKFKFLPKPSHLIATFLDISYRKPFDAAAHSSLTMNYSTQATFGLKKPAIQQSQKKFSVPNSFKTYGGFTL